MNGIHLHSMRWRLAVSFAGIALATAAVLGGVLWAVLREFYGQQERDYLQGNAAQISSAVAQLLQAELPPAVVADQASSWSFVLQARVRLQDAQGQVIADSGLPFARQVVMISSAAAPAEGAGVYFEHPIQAMQIAITGTVSQTMPLGEVAVVALDQTQPVSLTAQMPTWGMFVLPAPETVTDTDFLFSRRCYLGEMGGEPQAVDCPPVVGYAASPVSRTVTLLPLEDTLAVGVQSNQPVGVAMPLARTLYGFDLAGVESPSLRRSSQVVEQLVYGESGAWLGSVVLSDGPAYGAEILDSVLRGWAAASVAAVALAALAGWWISRRISAPLVALGEVTGRMAGGELSARAPAASADEFGALGRSFNEMAARIEEIVNTLRSFVADAAHELHTPLTALRTDLELAGSEDDPDRLAGFLAEAQAQTARLQGLVDGLLDLSRLEAGQGQRQPFDLCALAGTLAEPYASQAEQAGLRFAFQRPEEAVTVCGDAEQIRRAMGNLLDNAVKFTPPGGEVRLEVALEDGQACVRVCDTGAGIPQEDLPGLFQRFHRGRNAAGYPGSGLGLAIVKAVAEAHVGEARGWNGEQGGAVFEMRFRL